MRGLPEPQGIFWEGWSEYPDMKALLDTGLRPGEFFEFVTSTYVAAHLPYLKPVRVVLLERYRDNPNAHRPDEITRPITDAEIEQVLAQPHTNLGKFEDDVVFVGETDLCWWVLHLDCDVSDCCIGRTLKKEVTREQLMAWVDWYTDTKDGSWKPRFEIPVNRLRGWLSF